MRAQIDAFFSNDVAAYTRYLADLERRLGPTAEPREDEILDQLTAAGEKVVAACRHLELILGSEPQLLKDVQRQFRNVIAPWYDRSWFMHRAHVKPRGYPGDYEMLSALYDRIPKSRGISGYLDFYGMNWTLSHAVLARMRAVRRFLFEELARRRGEVSILNVACGPCREYWGGLEPPVQGCIRLTCLDSDQQALEYVRAHEAEMPGIEKIQYACYNALRLSSSKATVAKFGRPDVLYSVGLFDYLPDKPLVALLRGLRETVNPDGVVYVAFKDCLRYDKTPYQWMVDWFFLQRTEEQCRHLFVQAGYDMDGLEMTRDETGVIMNFVSRIKTERHFRVDRPETPRKEQAAVSRKAHSPHPLPAPAAPESVGKNAPSP